MAASVELALFKDAQLCSANMYYLNLAWSSYQVVNSYINYIYLCNCNVTSWKVASAHANEAMLVLAMLMLNVQ